jgi:hypothetical protein
MEEQVKSDLIQSHDYIHAFNIKNGQEIESWLWEVNVLWLLGAKEESIALFGICVDNDHETSKELFSINPNLLLHHELTDLVNLSE